MDRFIEFAAVGFFAMLVNGMLGMGFGIISAAILLAQGVAAPLVSVSVNAAKLPTLATLTLSHWMTGNLEGRVVWRIALWGVVGGLAGAFLLSTLKGAPLILLTNIYLVVVGLLILVKAFRPSPPKAVSHIRLGAVGFVGGAIEGIGGSWGPIVTPALLGMGLPARHAIGASMAAEAVVTVAVSVMLAATFGAGTWGGGTNWHGVGSAILGLIAGGLPASFAGGLLARKVPHRPLTIAVGLFALAVAAYRFAML